MRLITYKPDTQVMIKDHAQKEKGDGKMCAKVVGQFWVIDKLGYVNNRIQQTEESRPQVVHHNRMKPYTSRQPVIVPNWVKRISKTLEALAEDTEEAKTPAKEPKPGRKPKVQREVRLPRFCRVTRRKGEAVKMKPRRGRPKNAPKPVKMRAVELEEQRCVDPAPTHKTRSGRIMKRPSRYL